MWTEKNAERWFEDYHNEKGQVQSNLAKEPV